MPAQLHDNLLSLVGLITSFNLPPPPRPVFFLLLKFRLLYEVVQLIPDNSRL